MVAKFAVVMAALLGLWRRKTRPDVQYEETTPLPPV